jgi:leucine dehydrogenase
LNERTIPNLRCKIVAGAANNQLAEETRDGEALHERGILYAPDFVGNAGGLINVYNELTGYNRELALRMTRGIYQNMTRVFEISRAESIPPYLAADRVAEERLASLKQLRARHWNRMLRRRQQSL